MNRKPSRRQQRIAKQAKTEPQSATILTREQIALRLYKRPIREARPRNGDRLDKRCPLCPPGQRDTSILAGMAYRHDAEYAAHGGCIDAAIKNHEAQRARIRRDQDLLKKERKMAAKKAFSAKRGEPVMDRLLRFLESKKEVQHGDVHKAVGYGAIDSTALKNILQQLIEQGVLGVRTEKNKAGRGKNHTIYTLLKKPEKKIESEAITREQLKLPISAPQTADVPTEIREMIAVAAGKPTERASAKVAAKTVQKTRTVDREIETIPTLPEEEFRDVTEQMSMRDRLIYLEGWKACATQFIEALRR